MHIAAIKESCTDDEIIEDNTDGQREGEVVIEYIELKFDDEDPTKYRECLI